MRFVDSVYIDGKNDMLMDGAEEQKGWRATAIKRRMTTTAFKKAISVSRLDKRIGTVYHNMLIQNGEAPAMPVTMTT